MKIAILGGGFAGISLAWYISHYTLGSARIDLYDPAPGTIGASRLALGILNPFMGKRANCAWMAMLAIKETHRLITESAAMVCSPLVLSTGLLRPAVYEEQVSDFQATAIEFPNEAIWWDKQLCEEKIPGLQLPSVSGGLYIPHALTINVPLYLEGLWMAVARHSAQYLKTPMLSQEMLGRYDKVVVAIGANNLDFELLKKLPLTRVKGQVIELQWPDHIDPLPMSLSGEGQIVMSNNKKSCFVGSTYEKDFVSTEADPIFAKEQILKKVLPFFPALHDAPLLSCHARIRSASKGHLPLLGQATEKVWFLAGLGSKGLLYHALAARQLAQALLINNTSVIAPELLYPLA